MTLGFSLSYFCINFVFFGKNIGLKQIKGNLYTIAFFDGFCGITGQLLSSRLSFLSTKAVHVSMALTACVACALVHCANTFNWSDEPMIAAVALMAFSAPVTLNYLNIIKLNSYSPTERAFPIFLSTLIGKVGAFVSVQIVEHLPNHLFLVFSLLSLLLFIVGIFRS